MSIMAIFPFVYINTVFFALREILVKKNSSGILWFILLALPVYITTLSVSYLLGLSSIIPALQASKEILIMISLISCIWELRQKFTPTSLDWLVIIYTLYILLYTILPIGTFAFKERLLSFKSIAFFPVVYAVGRLINQSAIEVSRFMHYICLMAIATGLVTLGEVLTDQHLQQSTGYAAYNQYYMNVDPAGNFGLTWTFENSAGHKRFASFFSMPLEHAAATLISFAAIAALSLTNSKKISLSKFLIATLIATVISIIFALSRAAFVSYLLIIYCYAWLAGIQSIIVWSHRLAIAGLVITISGIWWMTGNLSTWVIETINFTDSSSISHVLEWVAGIEAIVQHPFGLGLGSSGRVSAAFGDNIGGENQLIIIGVQAGIIAMLLYIGMFIAILKSAIKAYHSTSLRLSRLGLFVFLIKIGLIIPLLTAEVESYIYISYLIWFAAGFLTNVLESDKKRKLCIER